jgi:hypothetical protein
MKTMTAKLLIATFAAGALANCQENNTARISVRLTDDSGKPIAGYKVQASWYDQVASEATKSAEGWKKEVWTGKFEESDSSGLATFEMRNWAGVVGFNLSQGLEGKRDRYYLTTIPTYKFQRVENNIWIPDNPVIEAVLKRKLKPIPMYAKNYHQGGLGKLKLAIADIDWFYDFEVGDWCAPQGTGKSHDITFSYTLQQEASGDYKRAIRVSFPNKGDGLIAFDSPEGTTTDYLTLRSDHSAPVDGYQPVVEKTRTMKGVVITDDANRDRNYYFRVRTKLDADGRVVSAHYGKIYGDFMSFIYYFNPTPNDRNVEYDPKRNLFVPEGKPFYQWPAQYQVNRP